MGDLWLDESQPRKAGLIRGQEEGLRDLLKSLPVLCVCDFTIPACGFWDYWPEQVLFNAMIAELPSKFRWSILSSDKR